MLEIRFLSLPYGLYKSTFGHLVFTVFPLVLAR